MSVMSVIILTIMAMERNKALKKRHSGWDMWCNSTAGAGKRGNKHGKWKQVITERMGGKKEVVAVFQRFRSTTAFYFI